jgi:hypothetical protein
VKGGGNCQTYQRGVVVVVDDVVVELVVVVLVEVVVLVVIVVVVEVIRSAFVSTSVIAMVSVEHDSGLVEAWQRSLMLFITSVDFNMRSFLFARFMRSWISIPAPTAHTILKGSFVEDTCAPC